MRAGNRSLLGATEPTMHHCRCLKRCMIHLPPESRSSGDCVGLCWVQTPWLPTESLGGQQSETPRVIFSSTQGSPAKQAATESISITSLLDTGAPVSRTPSVQPRSPSAAALSTSSPSWLPKLKLKLQSPAGRRSGVQHSRLRGQSMGAACAVDHYASLLTEAMWAASMLG